MTPQRIFILLAGAAAAVALFLLVRPDDEEATPPQGAVTGTTQTFTLEHLTVVRITAKGGKPVGGVKRISLRAGEDLRIVVRADVADHVHLHGYDLMRDVGPGAPAQLVFTADLVGVFELELEDAKLLLAELEVTP